MLKADAFDIKRAFIAYENKAKIIQKLIQGF